MSYEKRKRDWIKARPERDRTPPQSVPKVPMTEGQARWLKDLCRRNGVEFDPTLSKREAARLIDRLK